MKWADLVRDVESRLGSADARRIVERAAPDPLVLVANTEVPERAHRFVEGMVARRSGGEPLQYVVGGWGFRCLDLYLDARVLIPRPETETVVEIALAELARLRPKPVVVDLGTGSGAIALSIAVEARCSAIWATDASAVALEVATANLAGIGTAAVPVRLVRGNWFEAFPPELRGEIDLVVSNPPYVADAEELPAEVADWEPATALRAGADGLDAIAAIITEVPRWLRDTGALVLEIAPHQAEGSAHLARQAGFDDVDVLPDLTGRLRALVARR